MNILEQVEKLRKEIDDLILNSIEEFEEYVDKMATDLSEEEIYMYKNMFSKTKVFKNLANKQKQLYELCFENEENFIILWQNFLDRKDKI